MHTIQTHINIYMHYEKNSELKWKQEMKWERSLVFLGANGNKSLESETKTGPSLLRSIDEEAELETLAFV